MTINRKENQSLKDFKMVPTLQNVVEYVPKNRTSEYDHLDLSVLETLDGMKTLYQIEEAEKKVAKDIEKGKNIDT